MSYKVGLYIRLSREDDNKIGESESIKSQRELLLLYIKDNNYNLVDEYVDDGYSGTNFERPGFKKMINDIEKGKINMIIVKDISRLGRDHILTGYYMEQYFPLNEIRFVALNDSYDSMIESSANDFAPFKTVFNDMYACDISKKVRSSLLARKKQGLFTGWKAPYGYKRDPLDGHSLIIDDTASAIVKRIFQLALKGNSAKKIADILSNENILTPANYANLKITNNGLWNCKTISTILTNITYTGSLAQGKRKKIGYKVKKERHIPQEEWIIVHSTHPAIIDSVTFNIAQNIISKNKRTIDNKTSYLLSGFLFCRECGHVISINRSNDKNRNYCSCSHYRKYSRQKLCTPHTLNYDKLEKRISNIIQGIIYKQVDLFRLQGVVEASKLRKKDKLKLNIDDKKREMTCIKNGLDKVYIDKVKGMIDENVYVRICQKMYSELSTCKEELQEYEKKLCNINSEYDNKHLSTIVEQLCYHKLQRILLAGIIDKINISERKEVDVFFKVQL